MNNAKEVHKSAHEGYAYVRREIVTVADRKGLSVNVYEIPPGKAAYPYHYHQRNEEVFYILRGTGLLRTPAGEKTVTAGDFLYFSANENGAHKLMNASETETLAYIDFDTNHPLEAAFYPDSGKIGVYGENLYQIHRMSERVDYYDGE